MVGIEEVRNLNIITEQIPNRTIREEVMIQEDIREITITAEEGILPEAKVAIAVQELPEEVSNRNYFF